MTTFFEITAEQLTRKNRLVEIGKMINWEKMRYRFKKMNKIVPSTETESEKNTRFGQKPYDVMSMVRAMVIQQWHSLSDPGLEEALHDRMSFLLFCGFNPDEGIPDETTFCRFRNKLAELKLDKVLLRLINEQLENMGLKVSEVKGAVVDATIIESCCRPRRVIEIEQDREEEEPTEPSESDGDEKQAVALEESKDEDAKWLKKGNKSYFGYKAFTRTDVGDGFIDQVHVESANVSEMKHLTDVLGDLPEGTRVFADKGYGFKENRDSLKERKLRDALMRKAVRGKPLTHWEKVRNKIISADRYIVEQSYGTLKRIFDANRSSYRGKRKTENQLVLKSICLNLLKGFNKAARMNELCTMEAA